MTMRVAVTGSSGLIGAQLCLYFQKNGCSVVQVHRGASPVPVASAAPKVQSASWALDRPEQLASELDGVDAMVHLAGEPIAKGRWDDRKKARIYSSRVEGTASIVSALSHMKKKPKVLLCASGVGIYGDRRDELLDETSRSGDGFLAEVCKGWERAARGALDLGVRVVHMRFGIVLSELGGALVKMLPPFRLGMGGPIGSGDQYVSWISLQDALKAIWLALENDSLSGPVNFVSPGVVTNRQFAAALGSVLGKPARLRLPAWALRVAAGDLADEALLASQRAVPAALQNMSFSFAHPTLEDALQAILLTSK